jgi:mono/diheme cytochrome c family protein
VILRQLRLPELLTMRALDRVVRSVQVVTAVATAAFVILLFTNEPQRPAAIPDAGPDTGQAIFATRCASCHGADGGGGFGPTLAGRRRAAVLQTRRSRSVVANGRGSMPSFAESLTPEQITAVVTYTRTKLG